MGNVVFVVGMGPGNLANMTHEAGRVIQMCDVVIGYTVYVELLRKDFPRKEFMTTPMRQELERCRMCFEQAMLGKQVALVCSGDAGVYGMAAPMYELQAEYPEVELVVVPGITAANSGAAMLGAPLSHDFCVISLSDLLTPWELIEKRLKAAVMGDFCIAIYNPSSHKRADYLKRACEIMLTNGAKEDRACGYVENIGREGMKAAVCTLAELKEIQVNMFTTVFVGNSTTQIMGDKLVTKRGYQL